MPAPSPALRQRAFVAARGRVRTLNTKAALVKRFRGAPTVRSARVAGAGLVAVDGTVYRASIRSDALAEARTIYVINGGRPAAASYIESSETGEVKS
jgi:hypothetical protein